MAEDQFRNVRAVALTFSFFLLPSALSAVFTHMDDRSEPGLSTDPVVQKVNPAVATMIPELFIRKAWFGGYRIRAISLREKEDTCSDERFSGQLAPGSCTGVLIAPQILLTAGHCVQDAASCGDDRWVLDFGTEDPAATEIKIEGDSVYRCAEILVQHYVPQDQEAHPDYALVRLDRPVQGIAPVEVSSSSLDELLDSPAPLFAITSPSGQPKKLSERLLIPRSVRVSGVEWDASRIRKWADETGKILVTSSFSDGSSGGPLFSASGQLVGIVIAVGSRPFSATAGEGSCMRSRAFGIDSETNSSIPIEALTLIQPVSSIPELKGFSARIQ